MALRFYLAKLPAGTHPGINKSLATTVLVTSDVEGWHVKEQRNAQLVPEQWWLEILAMCVIVHRY